VTLWAYPREGVISVKIATIGAGHVGGALGGAFVSVGHTVCFGVRNPNKEQYRELVENLGSSASAAVPAEAVKDAGVVVLATPWGATQDALESAGSLAGKILIDCTNALKSNPFGLAIPCDTSAAELVAEWVPGARVCKAFNYVGANIMANPQLSGGKAAALVCGDDPEARGAVMKLAGDIGFDPMDAGDLTSAKLLEQLALLWIQLARDGAFGRDFAFALLHR